LRRLVLLLLTALVLAQTPIQADTQVRRDIHIADGGLVFVTDILTAPSQASEIALGFPLDMQQNLVGYYVVGVEALFEKRVEDGLLWLIASPKDGWPSGEVSIVTVWSRLLTSSGDSKYRLVIPSNPVFKQSVDRAQITLTSDGNPTINSVSGVSMQISSDKKSAEGSVEKLERGEFKTLIASFDNPDLVVASVVRAEVEADLQSSTVIAKILYQNDGGTAISSVDLILGKDAEVVSARSGLFKLGSNWDSVKGILTLNLPETLTAGRRVEIQLVYRVRELAARSGEGLSIRLPRLVNTTVNEYLFTVSTPPASELGYREEPWSLKLLENGKRQITFRYTNIYPTGRESVWVSFAPVPTIPVPLILLAAIVVVGAVNAVLVRPRVGRQTAVDKPHQQRLKQSVGKLLEDLVANVEVFESFEKPGKAVRPLDEQLKDVRGVLAEAKRIYKQPEQVGRLNNLERVLSELNATTQALARSAEDFKAGRLPKTVYRKLYEEYRRACLKLADQAYEILDELTR